MAIWIKILIGGGIGLLAGGVLGHFGKCSSGACPLTANPFRGAIVGAFIGVLIVLAWAERSQSEQTVGKVPHLANTAEFDEKVLKAVKPVLVDFYSDRCPPCRKLAPTISKLHTDYQGRADVFKVDVDRVAELAGRYEIRNIPTVILFYNGTIFDRCTWVGVRDESIYRKAIDEALSKRERSSQ